MLNQILETRQIDMGIGTISDYVRFYLNLEMGKNVSLSRFVNNEKRTLKGKLENKNADTARIGEGLEILDNLTKEINELGENEVLKKYGR